MMVMAPLEDPPGSAAGSAPAEMECRRIAELLADYIEGTLPRHTADLIEWHIEGCGPCVAFLNTYRSTIRSTRALPDTPMPPELKKRLLRVLQSDPQKPPPA